MGKKLRYSYTEKKEQSRRVFTVLMYLLVFFVLYASFTSFILSMRSMESNSMQPNIHVGDRFIFSSYLLYSPDLQRGNIVLFDIGEGRKRNFFDILLDEIIRFFTFQQMSVNKPGNSFYIKRVIALPGDEVSMTNFIMRVKPKGSLYQGTEFEISEKYYDVTIPQVPALWDESLPFHGNMDTLTLGENEYFLLSDDRSNTNDSRNWGPVLSSSIKGRALFRYWPLTRIGVP
ncbi:MAG: signal peptidase I [Treponema sp.]|jgi:signal peptidase I|nr:signal peptidase I [Treponema sp.]